jgi:hypothetical protein
MLKYEGGLMSSSEKKTFHSEARLMSSSRKNSLSF